MSLPGFRDRSLQLSCLEAMDCLALDSRANALRIVGQTYVTPSLVA
jgi:hypothetical protein